MGSKGEKTKKEICNQAKVLFGEKGFKNVTMQDICTATGLSRGGLYRHYESTGEIFQEILAGLLQSQEREFEKKMQKGQPAAQLLEEVLGRYEDEMKDSAGSLSLAILEYFSERTTEERVFSLQKQHEASRKMWIRLIAYGQSTGEFQSVDPQGVYDLLAYAYQGVRMFSRLIQVDPQTPGRITALIQQLLLVEKAPLVDCAAILEREGK